ncbi:MAG: tetratricopeptide repeat protein [Pseudomonadota bacterium]
MIRTSTISLVVAAVLGSTITAAAQSNSGAYLAARQASFESDYDAAASYFSRALISDPSNPILLENAVTAFVGVGNTDGAVQIAQRLAGLGNDFQVANIVVFADMAAEGDWEDILSAQAEGLNVLPVYDSLLDAWALVGAGRMGDALAAFDAIADTPGVQAFGLYHKALALGAVGDFEGAVAIFTGENGPRIRLTRRGLVAQAKILGLIGREADAIASIVEAFGTDLDAEMQQLITTLETDPSSLLAPVTNAAQGVAELNYSIASAVSGETSDSYTLLFSRMAEFLNPDHVDALLLSAGLLESLESYDLATESYDRVPREHPAFLSAELGRAGALRRSGKSDAAIEVLSQLGESHGDQPDVHVELGDVLRRMERYGEATVPYDRAIEIYGEPQEFHWPVYFARGITHEREGLWDKAEADFRQALLLRPEQPQVLNYLGYSFVEMKTNLDEALDMIERAVALEPESGYIADSLGWVYYQLGRYEEAVDPMERAVELVPVDPIITDHLGDVYWAVGRYREAEFQWHRALSFITDETDLSDIDPDRIRRKLEVGLYSVLEEEGAEPLRVVNDDG